MGDPGENQCARCHEHYSLDDGAEPSKYCHPCAQARVQELEILVAKTKQRALAPLGEDEPRGPRAIALLTGVRKALGLRWDEIGRRWFDPNP
jgi:hypothetical protein